MSHESATRVPAPGRMPYHGLFVALCTVFAVGGCDLAGRPTTVSLGGPIGTSSLKVSPSTATLGVGGTLQLTTNASAAALPLQWRSDRNDIATVSASGLVTGIAPGQAVIKAASSNDTTQTASSSVQVQ